MRKTGAKIINFVLFTLLIFSNQYALGGRCGAGGWGGEVPQPQLVRPTSEVVDLTGQKILEFKWLSNVGGYMGRQYFDFRLYKGYERTEQTLMYKERLPARGYHVIMDASYFADGQVYTWAVKQIYGIEKSNTSHVSFKVIKK